MSQTRILLIFGLLLAFIAFQARTGIFRHDSPKDLPANKYMRQIMANPQLSEADADIMRERYGNAHVNPSGLRYIERAPGEGPTPARGAELVVQYEGFLLDGTKFDSSIDRGKPFMFRVGTDRVIAGWDEAFLSMKKGEKRTLLIPWWLGYGTDGKGSIPGKATLRFEVELIEIK
jgi:FKBP-type peptidyl-prolyl cis-trans isomerase